MDEVADLMEELKLKATEGQLFSAAVKWCRCFGEDDEDMNPQVKVELDHRGGSGFQIQRNISKQGWFSAVEIFFLMVSMFTSIKI